jgi:hypothetical protein
LVRREAAEGLETPGEGVGCREVGEVCSQLVVAVVVRALGVALELLPPGLVAFDIRQTREAMTLQAPAQCRPCQVRDRRLQGIEAVVQQKERAYAFGRRRLPPPLPRS